MKTSFSVLLVVLLVGGCLSINSDIELADGETADGNLSTVNGSVRIGDDCTVNGAVKTVNGSINIGSQSTVSGRVETVNGKIALEPGARAESIEGVNGSISLGAESMLSGDAETVNGQIVVESGAVIDGTVSSVNGQIRIQGATVGNVKNTEGGIVVAEDSRVLGELRIVRPRGGFGDKQPPMVEIHADAEVGGPLVFEREVRLRIHESATVGEIQGAEPEYFTD